MCTFAVDLLKDGKNRLINMYDQQLVFSNSLYLMVYGGSMIFSLIACIYLMFRRSNAIAPEVTSPLRLRRWVAAFFLVMLLSHLWWYVLVKNDLFGDALTGLIVAATLDCMVLIPVCFRPCCKTVVVRSGLFSWPRCLLPPYLQ